MGWHQTLFREKVHGFAATDSRPHIPITDGWTWGECRRTNTWMSCLSMGQMCECPLATRCVRGMVVIHYKPVGETRIVGKIHFLKVQNLPMLVSTWLFSWSFPQQTNQSFYFPLYLHFLFKWLSTLQERESRVGSQLLEAESLGLDLCPAAHYFYNLGQVTWPQCASLASSVKREQWQYLLCRFVIKVKWDNIVKVLRKIAST